MAAELRKDSNLQVEVVEGGKGEFTVLVDGREVARKEDTMPDARQVLDAVRQAGGVAVS